MTIKLNYISLAIVAVLTGCGGGSGGSSDGGASTQNVKTGYFKDASVEGVEYKTATQSGITGLGGSFNYIDGEIVRFSIGSLNIGATKAAPVITPIELTSFLSPSDTQNVNIVRVLMLLDDDGIYSNGIQIPEEAVDYLTNEVDYSDLDITTENGMNALESRVRQLYPDAEFPTAEEAIAHFNQTVRCNLSGVFYGEYEGEGEGVFAVAIDPATLTPRGVFKPDDGYEYEWFGLTGEPLQLKGGAQPVALGSSDSHEYSGVVFSSVFDGADLSGSWSENGAMGGTVIGEKFISSQEGDDNIYAGTKYVGTYRYTGNWTDEPSGVMQILVTKNSGVKVIDWYDFSDSVQRHQGSNFNGGSVYIDLNNRDDSAEQILEFTIENAGGDVIDQVVIDSQGNEIELKLSSCTI